MSPGYGNKIYRARKFPLLFVIFLLLLGALVFFMVLPRGSNPGSFDSGDTENKTEQNLKAAQKADPVPIPDQTELSQAFPERGIESGFREKETVFPAAGSDGLYRLQARRFFENREYRKALDLLKKLPAPGYLDTRARGICHYFLEEYEPALIHLRQAIAVRGDDPVVLKFMAFSLYQMDQLEDSLNWADRALEIESQPEMKTFCDRLNREIEAMKDYADRKTARFKIIFSRFEHDEIRHRVTDTLKDAFREIGRQMGYYPRQVITVILYNEKAFFDITRVPAWVGGLYDGKIRLPIKGVGGQEDLLKRVLLHEYVHALIRDITPTCPLWIHEGLAEYFSSEQQTRIGQVFPLNQLEKRFPAGNPAYAILAYRESYSAVCELIARFGLYRIKDLLEAMAGGKSIGSAFESVFFVSYEAFQKSWGKR